MWLFGSGLAAQCVVAQADSAVEGVCLDDEFLTADTLVYGHKINALSAVLKNGPDRIMFVATGYKNLNRTRAAIIARLKTLGFSFCNVIPECFLADPTFSYGANNFVMKGAQIQPFVDIRDNVFIWSGATVCHHVSIGSNVWITAGATISGGTKIGSNVFIGANATIASGINLGSNIFIGAGALVVNSLPSNSAVIAKNSEPLHITADLFVKYLELKGNY